MQEGQFKRGFQLRDIDRRPPFADVSN